MTNEDFSRHPLDGGPDSQLPPEVLRNIDRICDVFEAQLNTQLQPKIERFLGQLDEPSRTQLFRELLRLDWRWRMLAGNTPHLEDYCRRFPEYAAIVEDVLRESPTETSSLPADAAWPSIPNYLIQAKIGRGAMGTVYRAAHTWLCNDAAIKVLLEDLVADPAAVDRFRREMRALGSLAHPNIVAARDAGESGGVYYLVMEYVEGLDLRQIVQQLGPLPVPDACEVARRTAEAIQHVHEHNLVHRDIKPSNLLLGHPPACAHEVELKLTDLGIARLRSQAMLEQVVAHERAGTVQFMAPEQYFSPAAVDIRADVYSLGIMLFNLLLGQPPFSPPEYGTRLQVIMAQRDTPVPAIRGPRPDVTDSLEEAISRMTAKNPAHRFQTPQEVAASLEPFCSGHNLSALLARANAERRSTRFQDVAPQTMSQEESLD